MLIDDLEFFKRNGDSDIKKGFDRWNVDTNFVTNLLGKIPEWLRYCNTQDEMIQKRVPQTKSQEPPSRTNGATRARQAIAQATAVAKETILLGSMKAKVSKQLCCRCNGELPPRRIKYCTDECFLSSKQERNKKKGKLVHQLARKDSRGRGQGNQAKGKRGRGKGSSAQSPSRPVKKAKVISQDPPATAPAISESLESIVSRSVTAAISEVIGPLLKQGGENHEQLLGLKDAVDTGNLFLMDTRKNMDLQLEDISSHVQNQSDTTDRMKAFLNDMHSNVSYLHAAARARSGARPAIEAPNGLGNNVILTVSGDHRIPQQFEVSPDMLQMLYKCGYTRKD